MYERKIAKYVENAVHRRECRVVRRINEKGRNKMDLESKSVMNIVNPTLLDVGSPGTHAPGLTERISRLQGVRFSRTCTGHRRM